MNYYIVFQNANTSFRLLADGNVRQDTNEFLPDDFVAKDPRVGVSDLIPANIEYNGNKYSVLPPSSKPFIAPSLLYTNYIMKPCCQGELCLPTINQLKTTIALGDDKITNHLMLDVFGQFQLVNSGVQVPFHTIVGIISDFPAGGDFVGVEAANSRTYINSLYARALFFYRNFIKTGRRLFYVAIPDSEYEQYVQDMIAEINELIFTSDAQFQNK